MSSDEGNSDNNSSINDSEDFVEEDSNSDKPKGKKV